MATIRIVDRTVTLTSKYTLEEIKEIMTVSPRTLELTDKEGDPIFGIFPATKMDSATVGPYGIGFFETNLSGKAKVSFNVEGDDETEVKNNAFKRAGDAFVKMQSVEAQIEKYLASRTEARTAFFAALSE